MGFDYTILGQAQLVQRWERELGRRVPTRRYPATCPTLTNIPIVCFRAPLLGAGS